MRCLGIPNTKHFHDITLIEDAQALYGKIKDQVSEGVSEWRSSTVREGVSD